MVPSARIFPRVLKVGGIQAANLSETLELIQRLRSDGPLSVVLSAPNTQAFRTTNILIESAQALAGGELSRSKELLLSVQDFILQTVCAPFHRESNFRCLEIAIIKLFQTYLDGIDFYIRERSPSARLYTQGPDESNDYVASVRKRPSHGSRGGFGKLLAVIPFLELGENISALMYAHLTDGIKVTSRCWMGEEISTVRKRVRESHNLIISGALRMNREEKMLRKFRRGYTDANAGRLAAGADAELLVHKEFPICTAAPQIVDGASQHIPQASMATIRASLHPLVGAQFLNPHVFANGEPPEIAIGVIGSDMVTHVVRRDIPDAHPLVQRGPRVRYQAESGSGLEQSAYVDERGDFQVISVIDHAPVSAQRIHDIRSRSPHAIADALDNRTASVLVSHEQADVAVRTLHAAFCEN